MEYEDDICVLQQSGDDQTNLTFGPFTTRTSYPLSDSSIDPGSHHALQKAYFELKKRLNDTAYRNQQLTKRVLELESARDFSDIGGSYDMMEDNSFVAEGGAAMPATTDPQMAAEEGYIHMLKRDLQRSKQQIQIIEKQYEDSMKQNEANCTVLAQKLHEAETRLTAALREKDSLQQTLDSLRGKDTDVEELNQKCRSLEIERDKAVREAMSASDALKKAQQELAELKEKQGDNLSADAPPEVLKEVTHLRQVIDSLKKMVLAQRSYLSQMESRSSSMSMRNSLGRSLKGPSSVEQDLSPPTSNRSGGSNSSHSWEVVNGGPPQSSLDRQKQLRQQQMQQQQIGQQRQAAALLPNQPGIAASVPATSVPSQNIMNGGMDTGRVGMVGGRVENVYSGQIMSTGQNMMPGQVPRKASTEVIRRTSEEEIPERRSRTEYIRAPPSQSPKLADWMGNHFQQQGGVNMSSNQPAQTGFNQPQAVAGGYIPHSQVQQQGGMTNNMASQSRPAQQPGMQYRQGQPHPYSPSHQMSPGRELPSTYDNLHYANGPGHAAGAGNIGVSMHIFNQGVMSGGRVVQTSSDSFGSGSNTPTASHLQTGTAITLSRDGGQRGLPQEHSDLNLRSCTASPNPTDLLPPVAPVGTAHASENKSAVDEDRKCPVCSQDFSHISMDDFQTHVFECFDDADESPGPETLQPQTAKNSTERVCPMCNKHFDETVTQQYFELHVQSHFEEGDPFEVLHVTNP